ncbi:DUF1552 domain-containing protein [Sorangium sp. So ce394]|uniref:DUF1552 domain-containing protein n=1 Tax=Sorangium sp. So ce394 TaxID=3133310 RepID=UPI003F5BD0C6
MLDFRGGLYLDSLREIEKNVARVQSTIPANLGCAPIAEPGMVPEPPGQGLNEDDSTEAGEYKHEDHANVMIDLLVMAIQCAITTPTTFRSCSWAATACS